MRFSEYMSDWLYGESGYYKIFRDIGKGGDFYTAVSTSPFFGASIANYLFKKIESQELNRDTLLVEIGGHTDSIGSYGYNKELSQKRANSVKNYITQHGIDNTKLKAIGYGERNPIVSNMLKSGRAKNRRIEFIIKEIN